MLNNLNSERIMTRNDIIVQFNKEKDLHVLHTEGTGYINYTDDYVHWLEDIALKQANGAEQSGSTCNLQNVSQQRELLFAFGKYLQKRNISDFTPQMFIDDFLSEQ